MSGAELAKNLDASGTGPRKMAVCVEVLTANPKATDFDIIAAYLMPLLPSIGLKGAELEAAQRAVATKPKEACKGLFESFKQHGGTNGTLEKCFALVETGTTTPVKTEKPKIWDEIIAGDKPKETKQPVGK